ncbi:MAG TPA: hypothetical protein VN892_14400 [Solirubrobacteraceae bacterium]|nr:hypothetical protein [Solirubrobacteraceae bacterium]
MRLFERAMFWATIAGVAAICGGVFVAIGLALRPADSSAWSEPWFDVGVGTLGLSVVFLLVAVRHYLAEQGKSVATVLGRIVGVARSALQVARSALQIPVARRRPSIIRAAYGSADVTERVRSLVRVGLPFTADNGTLVDDVDPDLGVFKRLEIEYRADGSTTTTAFDEGTRVELP